MEDIILSLIRSESIAAEAAYELNPSSEMEHWCDDYMCKNNHESEPKMK